MPGGTRMVRTEGLAATAAGAALREIPTLHFAAVVGWLVGRS